MHDNIHTLPHGHYRYRQQEETIQDIDWDEDIDILHNNDILNNGTTNEKNESVYEDIDGNDSILPTENNKDEIENTANSLCIDIDWEYISIVNEKNISTPQTTGEEEQRMVDTYVSNIKLGVTQKNIYENNVGEGNNNIEENNVGEKEQQNTEERAEIYNWFEENNVNSYDMEAEWEIPAFSMSQ